jgi:drug/metabolite transporter (DMT)-like permease
MANTPVPRITEPQSRLPEFVLIVIAMIWGATFLIIQHALSKSGPMFFVGLRFGTAAVLTALLSGPVLRGLTLLEIRAGIFIGVAIALGYGLQTVGLQTIPSSKSAFITALYVPVVPLLQWAVLRRFPGLMSWVGIALAFLGLVCLAGPEGMSVDWNRGELLTLVGAVAIAAEVIMIGAYAGRTDADGAATGRVDVRRVTVVQLATASVLAFCAMAPTGEAAPGFSWLLVLSAAGLGAASSAIQLAMNWAQRTVSPTRATVIYAGEPVWGGVFGRMAGERLPALALLGAALIVGGVVASELRLRRRPSTSADQDQA